MSLDRDELIFIEGTIRHETEKAYLFEPILETDAVWLPKSCCDWDSYLDTMTVPRWLAKAKGLL